MGLLESMPGLGTWLHLTFGVAHPGEAHPSMEMMLPALSSTQDPSGVQYEEAKLYGQL